jgi:uncharacterized protein with GYD domain
MSKFLWKVSYSSNGLKGLVKDLPDNISAVAISLAVNAAGAVQIKTVPLLSPEEVDEATKKSVDYRPPGS